MDWTYNARLVFQRDNHCAIETEGIEMFKPVCYERKDYLRYLNVTFHFLKGICRKHEHEYLFHVELFARNEFHGKNKYYMLMF